MSALATEARRIREVGHLNDHLIAAATGAKPSTVRDWFSDATSPSGARADRLMELAAMVDRLAGVMDRDYIAIWLARPLAALDDDKPVELIAQGQYRRVARIVGELEYPGVA